MTPGMRRLPKESPPTIPDCAAIAVHARMITPTVGRRSYNASFRSVTCGFAKYPRLPILSCSGYVKAIAVWDEPLSVSAESGAEFFPSGRLDWAYLHHNKSRQY